MLSYVADAKLTGIWLGADEKEGYTAAVSIRHVDADLLNILSLCSIHWASWKA